MTRRAAIRAAILVVGLACPASLRAEYRTETCKGEVEIDLGNRSLKPDGWLRFPRSGISPGRALELADSALRRSGLLGDGILALEIRFVALRGPTATADDRFYRIHYTARRCPPGVSRLNHAFVLVGPDGAVLLPAAIGGQRGPVPPRPQTPRWSAPRPLAAAYDAVRARYEKLATGLDQTFQGVRCSLVGCPGYDLVLSSVSWEEGPPDVKIDAGALPARVLWFPRRDGWPRLSPAEAIESLLARDPGGTCDLRGEQGRLVPGLRLARPGGWLYVLELVDGRRCHTFGSARENRLQGELVVLMTGDLLVPTDGAFTWLPRNPEDDTAADEMVFYNLLYRSPIRRRFAHPSW